MTRIVTYAYRYKRPPRKRKAIALEVPAIVKAGKGRPAPEPVQPRSLGDRHRQEAAPGAELR
jgi:hypothetical protein